MKLKYYIHRFNKYPLHILFIKILNKLLTEYNNNLESLIAKFSQIQMSNEKLLKATLFDDIDSLINLNENEKRSEFFLFPEKLSGIKEINPDIIDKTVSDADKICSHIFNLLGSGDVYLGEKLDWHSDFKIGWRWKTNYYKKIRPSDFTPKSDIKVPWELSRCQHFITLGKAYQYTRNEKYSREFTDQVNDWINSNPPKFGVNWVCAMDVAIRAVNWIWGFFFFKQSSALTNEFVVNFFKSMLIHGRHIMSNLEKTEISGNHYISNLVGLVYIGIMFPEFKESKQWREFGVNELINEMDRQVFNDGVDYENSTCYHRLVTELFISATLLCLMNRSMFSDGFAGQKIDSEFFPFPDWYMKKLEKMFEFIMYYTKPDGMAPQIGDNDNGRLHILSNYGSWNILDHRYLLAIGAELFGRKDFAYIADNQSEEAFWLNKNNQPSNTNAIPIYLTSKAFIDSGFYIMRNNNLYMLIDCLTNRQNSPSGHKHNSRLSFELFAYDKTFIIDPGTYVYNADAEWRNIFRSTPYHNTTVINGKEQNEFNAYELFSLRTNACVKINKWEITKDFDFLDAQHDGYEHLNQSAIHRRQIFFDKIDGYWLIKDLVYGLDVTNESYFHFAPMDIISDDYYSMSIRSVNTEGANIILVPVDTKGIEFSIENGWVSYSYGAKVNASIVKYTWSAKSDSHFTTILYPYIGNRPDYDKINSVIDKLPYIHIDL